MQPSVAALSTHGLEDAGFSFLISDGASLLWCESRNKWHNNSGVLDSHLDFLRRGITLLWLRWVDWHLDKLGVVLRTVRTLFTSSFACSVACLLNCMIPRVGKTHALAGGMISASAKLTHCSTWAAAWGVAPRRASLLR